MLPQYIETAADFHRVVRLGETPESAVLEFKQPVEGWKSKDSKTRQDTQKELCRDLSQFANANGGCLLLGISEVEVNGKKVAGKVVAVSDVDACRQWLEQATVNYLVPTTMQFAPHVVELEGGPIVAVNVAPAQHLVWLWDRQAHTIEAWRRGNFGKVPMNPDDAEQHLMNGSRAAKLALARAFAAAAPGKKVRLVGGVWLHDPNISQRLQLLPNVHLYLANLGEYEFQLGMGGAASETISAPYGLLREAWNTTDGHIGLLLSVRIIVRPHGVAEFGPL